MFRWASNQPARASSDHTTNYQGRLAQGAGPLVAPECLGAFSHSPNRVVCVGILSPRCDKNIQVKPIINYTQCQVGNWGKFVAKELDELEDVSVTFGRVRARMRVARLH